MKNRLLKGITTLLMMIGLASCGGGNGSNNPSGGEVKIYLATTSLEMERFDDFRILYDVVGTTEALTWTSSDTAIASVVHDGLVTAHEMGECVITASIGSVSASCTVTVNPNTHSPVLHIETLTVNLLTDSEPYEDGIYVTYKQSTIDVIDYRFNFYDVPNDVVSCKYENDSLVITPLKAGETVITVSAIAMATVVVQTVNVTVTEA